ncbi:MAG: hypothetical protein ACI9IV_001320 [Paracoccaceae bacterium]
MQKISLGFLVLGGLIAPFAALFMLPAKAGAPVLVVSTPWASAASLIAKAHGDIIGPWSAPLALLAYSSDPDFIENLHQAGAFAVLNGETLARLCGIS